MLSRLLLVLAVSVSVFPAGNSGTRAESVSSAERTGLDESGQKAQDYPARTGISAGRGP